MPISLRGGAATLLLALANTLAAAQPVVQAEAEAAAPVQLLEYARHSARRSADWLARTVDGWFGDAPNAEGPMATDGRLALGIFKRQDQTTDVDARFNARFSLPNAQRQAYLFIGRDDPRVTLRDTPAAMQTQQQMLAPRLGERSLFGGLGLTLDDAVDFRLGLGSRLRPYGQARLSKAWQLAPAHVLSARETLFWTHSERFGATSTLSYDIAASRTLALRWLNVATITQQTQNVEWSSTLGAYQGFNGERLLSLEAVANGTGQHGTGVGASDLGLLVKWEQPIYQQWVFLEGLTGHYWPRHDAQSERTRAWAMGLNLKVRF